ncbi:conserved hypothetical protein [Neospora caninum Liverpool]|uniref:Transmembrane protein n=1 Tax=Neospora caninum (strain Liverpool) TaxID=572307 RepID=F0V7P1_NEOCL|nr:conserved hypothetical protein [Neospora caninum Liverpool]CBZ49732.1 conserved hypothetical protein [Neospora caninum Liverpool]CEL64316.1 TPA: hypothetical protein BN1204_002190 [Neospora caninum Liverpool]|eukprot:XP_003879767.1 conserved hypothetical protein [Neospora caninum Liverpool]
MPNWAAPLFERVAHALKHYAAQVQEGDPIYVTLALFVAFFAVVGVSYLQYRQPTAAVHKRAGGKSRSRKKKPASGSDGVLSASGEDADARGEGASLTPDGKLKRRTNQGMAEGETSRGDGEERGTGSRAANEPVDSRDGEGAGEGEWQVVTNKRKKKQK